MRYLPNINFIVNVTRQNFFILFCFVAFLMESYRSNDFWVWTSSKKIVSFMNSLRNFLWTAKNLNDDFCVNVTGVPGNDVGWQALTLRKTVSRKTLFGRAKIQVFTLTLGRRRLAGWKIFRKKVLEKAKRMHLVTLKLKATKYTTGIVPRQLLNLLWQKQSYSFSAPLQLAILF